MLLCGSSSHGEEERLMIKTMAGVSDNGIWSWHQPYPLSALHVLPSRFPREFLPFFTTRSPPFNITPRISQYLNSCANTGLPRFVNHPVIAIMSSTDPTHGGSVDDPAQTVAAGKGKGKASDLPPDVSMGEDDSSSDEETGAEDEVCPPPLPMPYPLREPADTLHS